MTAVAGTLSPRPSAAPAARPVLAGPRPEMVIFDCDGVLVDSEPLATRVLQEALALNGVRLTLDQVVEQFLGRSPETIALSLRRDHGLDYDEAMQQAAQERLFALFRTDLRAIAGVEPLLQRLDLPYCLASSSQMPRIELALRATALARHFDGRIFNAAMVARGKPAPDLFLHAAAQMGVPPAGCLVVEDSPAGVEAARRAGMRVVGFTGGGHARTAAHRASLAILQPDLMLEEMQDLAEILGVPGFDTTGSWEAAVR